MPVLYAVRQHVGTGAGLAGFGALVSSARVHRFAGFLFAAGFLRNVVLDQKFVVTLRAGGRTSPQVDTAGCVNPVLGN